MSSGADGTFTITGDYSCPAGALVYLAAIGGNPGVSSANPNIAMMTALGPCSALSASTFVQVNELTTVAAVTALAPYMSSVTAIGSSDAASLTAAFNYASELVNPATGTSPGIGVPAGETIPTQLINSLGDLLSTCVNSAGGSAGDGSACGQLFSMTAAGSSAPPADTVAAMLDIAYNPGVNTAALFSLVGGTAPFQPILTATPSSFAIAPSYSSTQQPLQSSPATLVFPVTATGIVSAAQSITVQNTTSAAVTVSAVSLTGLNAAEFAQTNNCVGSLAASATCAIQVTGTPNAQGAQYAFVEIDSNSVASPQFVPITLINGTPSIIGFSPASLGAGTPMNQIVWLTGTNLLPSSIVQVNGSSRATYAVTPTELEFEVTPADKVNLGSLSITVTNPPPGGGISTAALLNIVTPTATPVIIDVYPTQFFVGSVSTVEILGSNFTNNSVILWNGASLPTSFYSYTSDGVVSMELYADVSANPLASLGTASISVYSPTANPTLSNAVSVSITNPPLPTITSISPGGAPLNTATSITLTGTGFTSSSTVQMDGNQLVSQYNNDSLTAQVPASAVTLLGNHSINVSTPAPGGGTSAPVTFTAYVGIQTNAMALNLANGLLYVSVPGSAGPPFGDSVVSVDPATGALGTPINVGSEPDKLAISSDGSTLWVGLDGAAAIRQVNLTTGTAGMQFSLGGNTGLYDYPIVAHAIAVLPGAPNSIVASVRTNNGSYEDELTIYDSGVPRPNQIVLSADSLPAIFVSPNSAEVYATSLESGYQVLSYNASGLTNIAGNSGTNNYSAPYGTAVQVDNGQAYLDKGVTLNAETGALLGTFYSSGTTAATGPMVSVSSLGKLFILENAGSTTGTSQIQAFNESTFTAISSGTISVNGALSGYKYGAGNSTETELDGNDNIDTLVHWGANGLAFRAANGVFSFHSNVVQDLSSTNADLAVALAAPASAPTGSGLTVTATVTNNGPSAATDVVLSSMLPSNFTFVSATSSQGSCSTTPPLSCNLGSLANGSTATVVLSLQALASGTASVTATVAADQNDSVTSNNSSTASIAVSGSNTAAVPVITAVSPNVVLAGSQDTTIGITGTGFASNSLVYLGSQPLSASYVSSTQLQAIVPSSQMAQLGWWPIQVSTPAPGGGTSSALPFTVYSLVNLAANHLIYDPYSRLLYASVSSAAAQVTGNSIASIDPTTGDIGTPVNVGSQPSSLALTDDGEYLYVNLVGGNSVGRFNMLTQSLDFSFPITLTGADSYDTITLRDIAAMPGTDTTVAVDTGEDAGFGLWDINPATQTGTLRGGTSGTYTGSSLQFLNASSIFSFDIDTSLQTFDKYSISASGLSGGYTSQYTLNSFSPFKIRGGLAYANAGGVANPALAPVAPVGVFLQPMQNTGGPSSDYANPYGQVTEPDPSLGLSFFALTQGTMEAFNQSIFTFAYSLTLPTINGTSPVSNTPFTIVDFTRWGQDGLAMLTSTGQIVLLRGAFVVPEELSSNSPATLTSSSATSIAHGSANTLLTLTGSNFVPGVGVFWNGSYRTTTIVDANDITAAIPASDLTAAGTASITVVNPGAAPSNAITLTVN